MTGQQGLGRAWYAVAVLGALYVVAFVDRMILGLLVEPLKADLGITDTEISLLIGLAFAVFYSVIGVPMGGLADRANRRNIIVATSLLWAACTFASGLAASFWVLCLMRIGVAVGEAALSPSALSLISDLFPRERRARAASIYMAVGALGATGAYLIGGLVIRLIGADTVLDLPVLGRVKSWQAVFFAVATPALLLSLAMLTVREPPRQPSAAPPRTALTWAWLTREYRPTLLLFLGSGVGQIIVLGVAAWGPSYLIRAFGWDIARAGVHIGLVSMAGAVSGMLIVPALVEAWRRRGRGDALPLTQTIGILAGAPCVIAAALAPTPALYLTFFGLGMFCLMGTGLLPLIAVQWAVPSNMRGEFTAVALLANSSLSMAVGPTAVSMAAQALGGPQHLGGGIAAVALACGPLAALLVFLSRPGLTNLQAREAAT